MKDDITGLFRKLDSQAPARSLEGELSRLDTGTQILIDPERAEQHIHEAHGLAYANDYSNLVAIRMRIDAAKRLNPPAAGGYEDESTEIALRYIKYTSINALESIRKTDIVRMPPAVPLDQITPETWHTHSHPYGQKWYQDNKHLLPDFKKILEELNNAKILSKDGKVIGSIEEAKKQLLGAWQGHLKAQADSEKRIDPVKYLRAYFHGDGLLETELYEMKGLLDSLYVRHHQMEMQHHHQAGKGFYNKGKYKAAAESFLTAEKWGFSDIPELQRWRAYIREPVRDFKDLFSSFERLFGKAKGTRQGHARDAMAPDDADVLNYAADLESIMSQYTGKFAGGFFVESEYELRTRPFHYGPSGDDIPSSISSISTPSPEEVPELAHGLPISAFIPEFLNLLPDRTGNQEGAGLYLSMLINKYTGPFENIRIDANDYHRLSNSAFNFLGTGLSKGSLTFISKSNRTSEQLRTDGNMYGAYQSGGEIAITTSGKDSIGVHQRGGKLVVNVVISDLEGTDWPMPNVGHKMEGGEAKVSLEKTDVGYKSRIGELMSGGHITLETGENIDSLAELEAAERATGGIISIFGNIKKSAVGAYASKLKVGIVGDIGHSKIGDGARNSEFRLRQAIEYSEIGRGAEDSKFELYGRTHQSEVAKDARSTKGNICTFRLNGDKISHYGLRLGERLSGPETYIIVEGTLWLGENQVAKDATGGLIKLLGKNHSHNFVSIGPIHGARVEIEGHGGFKFSPDNTAGRIILEGRRFYPSFQYSAQKALGTL